jgi:hypothetical protein
MKMAISNLDKAKTLVRGLQAETEKLMSAVERYTELQNQINATGIAFGDYDAQYAEETGLKHIDGDVINAVLTQFGNIKTYLDTSFNKDPLNKFRTGA